MVTIELTQGGGSVIPQIFRDLGNLERVGGFRSEDPNFYAQALNSSTYKMEVDEVARLPYLACYLGWPSEVQQTEAYRLGDRWFLLMGQELTAAEVAAVKTGTQILRQVHPQGARKEVVPVA